jgi:hypothetical protein
MAQCFLDFSRNLMHYLKFDSKIERGNMQKYELECKKKELNLNFQRLNSHTEVLAISLNQIGFATAALNEVQ